MVSCGLSNLPSISFSEQVKHFLSYHIVSYRNENGHVRVSAPTSSYHVWQSADPDSRPHLMVDLTPKASSIRLGAWPQYSVHNKTQARNLYDEPSRCRGLLTRSPAIAEGPRDAGVPVEIW